MRFYMICKANEIEHRLTKPSHPWSREEQKTVRGTAFLRGGQVERMNRTIKEATVKRYHYDRHDQLRTPYQYICKIRRSKPDRSIIDPIHQMPGLNT